MGDLGRDGFAELLVGVPGENGTGAVHRFSGSRSGPVLSTSPLQFQPGFGSPEQGDLFGSGLAIADFDGNGYGDIAAAAPGETVGAIAGAGEVNILYSAPPEVIWLPAGF